MVIAGFHIARFEMGGPGLTIVHVCSWVHLPVWPQPARAVVVDEGRVVPVDWEILLVRRLFAPQPSCAGQLLALLHRSLSNGLRPGGVLGVPGPPNGRRNSAIAPRGLR